MFQLIALFVSQVGKVVKGYFSARKLSKQIQEDRKNKFGSTAGRRWKVGSLIPGQNVKKIDSLITVQNVKKLVENSKGSFTLSNSASKQFSFVSLVFLLICAFFIIRK